MLPCWPGKLHCCSSTAAAVYQGRLGQGCQVTAAAVQVVQILLLQGRVGQNVYSYTHVCCFPGPETGAWQALRHCLQSVQLQGEPASCLPAQQPS